MTNPNNPSEMGTTINENHSSATSAQGWNLSRLVISTEQVEIAHDLHTWLSESPLALAQSIAQFSSGQFKNDQMRQLEDDLIKKFSPLPIAAKYLQVLCKVVDAINHATPTPLPFPRIPNLVNRPKNPFRSGVPSVLRLTRAWREALSKSLTTSPESTINESPKSRLGELFTSAVVHGGLADPELLISLARSLRQPKESILDVNSRIAVELSIAWRGELGSEHRMWFPDPLTATLIAQQFNTSSTLISANDSPTEDTDEQIRKQIGEYVSAFFKATKLRKDERPKSLSDLTRTAKVDLHTRLPQVLANYAGRALVSHSPSKQVFARIYGFPVQHKSPQDSDLVSEHKDQVTMFNNNSDNLGDFEPHWLSELRSAFASNDLAIILDSIDTIIAKSTTDSVGTCFSLFARYLASARLAGNNKLALSTARSYLVTVAKRLGGRLGNIDPHTLDVESLENLYTEILEDADTVSGVRKQRRRIARSLREFHQFLVRECQAESIDERDVLGIGKGLVPVDANLITIDEYLQTLSQIPKSVRKLRRNLPEQEKFIGAARLIFTLAFKCGLRRMEVLKLKIADLCEHDPAELLTRPSEARRLKTKSSTRKLPLYALLTNLELDEFKRWKKSRLNELKSDNPTATHEELQSCFLFGIPELNFEFIPQDTLFPILHDAMRVVTGDTSLRFHHLRHSFASWTFLRLMLSDLPNIPKIFPHLPRTTEYLNDSSKFRDKLYGRADPTRRHVYAVASLLGHSGPEISLEHYIHFCDILNSIWLQNDVSAPSKKSLIQAAKLPTAKKKSGRSKSAIYRMCGQGINKIPYLIARSERLIARKTSSEKAKPANSTNTSTPVTSSLDNPAIFDTVWDILHRHALNHTSIEDLVSSSGLPASMIKSFISKTSEISEMTVEKGKDGYRHRMITATLDRRDSKSRLACPMPPHSDTDKNVIKRLAPKLLEAFHQHPKLCEAVFEYYLNNAWQTRNEVIFKDVDDPSHAKQFMVFLDSLGCKTSEVQIVLFDKSPRSRALAKWKEHLELSWRRSIIKCSPPNKQNLAAKNWLGIKPIFHDGKEPIKDAKIILQGSIAFRYLMVLGAIIFPEWENEERRIEISNF